MLVDLKCTECGQLAEDVIVRGHLSVGQAISLEWMPCPECGGTRYERPGIERTANMSAQWGESCRGDGHKYLGGGKSNAAKKAAEFHRARAHKEV